MRRTIGCGLWLVVAAAVIGLSAGVLRQYRSAWLTTESLLGSARPQTQPRRPTRSGSTEPWSGRRSGAGLVQPAPEERSPAEALGLRAAIIIDDVGWSLDAVRPFLEIDADLTFSILPSAPLAPEIAHRLDQAGRCVMLHLPMEPHDQSEPLQQDTIMVAMSDAEVAACVERALERVACASGVNNHMGSKATGDRRVMDAVMSALAPRGLFFVDSRTGPKSVALDVADAAGVPALGRDVFLDAAGEQDVYAVTANMEALARVASHRGVAIGIGHPRRETAEGIRQGLSAFESEGVRIVQACSLFQ